jgi:hypothetical protein
VSIRRKVRVALRRRVVLMAQERLDVVERDAVLHEPAGCGVPHDARREPADLVLRVVAEVLALATLEFVTGARGRAGRGGGIDQAQGLLPVDPADRAGADTRPCVSRAS